VTNKSSLNINVGERYNNIPANHPEEFSIKDVSVHSMKEDLEIIKNPTLVRQEPAPLPVSYRPKNTSPLKISPFLEKTGSASTTPVPPKKPENIAGKPAAKQLLEPAETDSFKPGASKKIFVFSTIFLSVIALGVGSYYFWLIRGKNAEPPVEELEAVIPDSAPAAEEPSLPAAVIKPETKTEELKENTIVLDLENSNPTAIKTAIKNQIEKLPKESFVKPVEFNLKDSRNNLLDFSLFAKKSGMTFTQNLSAYLGESFSLLAFYDGSNLGTGLIIESKNDSFLAQRLLEKELTLTKDLNVLFLTAAPKETRKVSFSSFAYKDISLRYFNLISPEKLSIDYAVAKNNLIIGTTRNTFLALYDFLLDKLDAE